MLAEEEARPAACFHLTLLGLLLWALGLSGPRRLTAHLSAELPGRLLPSLRCTLTGLDRWEKCFCV